MQSIYFLKDAIMNIRKILLAGFFAVSSLVCAPAAQASIVNLGTVNPGESGSLPGNYSNLMSGASGFIQSNSIITFTYTFNPSPVFGSLIGNGSYGTPVDYQYGESTAIAGGAPVSTGYTGGIASTPLVFATANLTTLGNTTTGVVTVSNFSNVLASFSSLFFGLLGSPSGIQTLTYNVSAVPLPAALPLFGALIASLFGFRHFRKQGDAVVAAA
jgi:hypothetical protein